MRLINADELITAFPCGESVRTESVRATINHMPTIEVSEDAVSREQLKSLSYINKGNFNSVEGIRDWIDAAPSVVPQQKEEETPTCSECDHYEDHHTSLACANCPIITKVWGGAEE